MCMLFPSIDLQALVGVKCVACRNLECGLVAISRRLYLYFVVGLVEFLDEEEYDQRLLLRMINDSLKKKKK